MSFSDAIGQIDQILQWQQQISDPAALLSGSSTSPTSASSSAPNGSASTQDTAFADALTQAQMGSDESLGTDSSDPSDGTSSDGVDSSDLLSGGDSQLLQSLNSIGTTSGGSSLADTLEAANSGAATGTAATTPTADVASVTSVSADSRVQAMVKEANSLIGKPYVWGGGHSGWGSQGGYDCSGFVSKVLHAGGYLSTPQDTATLPSAAGIENGPGQQVTIYDRTDEGSGNDHVIIDIGGQFYESGGEQGAWGGGGGVQKIATPSASYLATFNRQLHPAGL